MPTLYDIKLMVRYTYQSLAGGKRSVLRLQPLTTPEQRLVTGEMVIDPVPAFRADGLDFFGNPMTEVAFEGQQGEFAFGFAGRVERRHDPDRFDLSCPLPELAREIAQIRSIAPASPHHFLGVSPRVRPSSAITAFARDLAEPKLSTLQLVARMSTVLHQEIAFDPTATDVMTTPADAFEARRGVCQDISHIMIAALRSVGVPAGYVSGFLRTEPPEGQPRLEGADAMHAWVRAWCGKEIGWVEIDPTNDLRAADDHISVAVGRDYSDVAPVKGSIRTAGAHTTSHSVDMIPV